MDSASRLLSIKHLKKYYEGHKAVDDISFDLQPGTIFGLLGPNGAGKTTLIRMITGIIYPDEGEIFLEDSPFKPLQDNARIGYMPEERGLYKKMKVKDQLRYFTRLKGIDKKTAEEKTKYWADRFDLTDWWDKKVGDLSKGMQQKVQFITTIVHNPKLLILDEPFSGLDPINTDIIKQEIYNLCKNGTTVIFSTHRMEQVEEICEHIVLVNKGEKLIDGKVADIKHDFKKKEFSLILNQPIEKEDLESSYFMTESVNDNKLILKLKEGIQNNELLQHFIQKGYTIQSFNEILPSLNDVFIDIVQN